MIVKSCLHQLERIFGCYIKIYQILTNAYISDHASCVRKNTIAFEACNIPNYSFNSFRRKDIFTLIRAACIALNATYSFSKDTFHICKILCIAVFILLLLARALFTILFFNPKPSSANLETASSS